MEGTETSLKRGTSCAACSGKHRAHTCSKMKRKKRKQQNDTMQRRKKSTQWQPISHASPPTSPPLFGDRMSFNDGSTHHWVQATSLLHRGHTLSGWTLIPNTFSDDTWDKPSADANPFLIPVMDEPGGNHIAWAKIHVPRSDTSVYSHLHSIGKKAKLKPFPTPGWEHVIMNRDDDSYYDTSEDDDGYVSSGDDDVD